MKGFGKKSINSPYWKEPLLHFLLAGFALFIFNRFYAHGITDEDAIVVDQKALMNFMQYQSLSFDSEDALIQYNKLSSEEIEQLKNQYIREEVLYRRALSLGLDKNDYVIKRRVIQKMEFLLDDFDVDDIEIKEADLMEYYKNNSIRYTSPPFISFTHIFFKENNSQRALALKEKLDRVPLTLEASLPLGDRFLYQRNYIEKNKEYISSQFGKAFSDTLFGIEPWEQLWLGPVSSEHGAHLVQIIDRSDGGVKPFLEMLPTIKEDYLLSLKEKHITQKTEDLIDQFEIIIKLERS